MKNHKSKSVVYSDHAHRVEVSNQVKIGLIRKFQRIEGNFDCCASAYTRVCKQSDCLWRDECLTMTQG